MQTARRVGWLFLNYLSYYLETLLKQFITQRALYILAAALNTSSEEDIFQEFLRFYRSSIMWSAVDIKGKFDEKSPKK